MSGQADDEGYPWYLKLMFLVVAAVLAFVIVVDLLEFAGAL